MLALKALQRKNRKRPDWTQYQFGWFIQSPGQEALKTAYNIIGTHLPSISNFSDIL